MLNFGASKPRVKGGPGPPEPPWIRTWIDRSIDKNWTFHNRMRSSKYYSVNLSQMAAAFLHYRKPCWGEDPDGTCQTRVDWLLSNHVVQTLSQVVSWKMAVTARKLLSGFVT